MTHTLYRTGRVACFVLLCICAFFFCLSIQAAEIQTARPNIIIIISDDIGFSDLGSYGGEINTPVLDSLAAGGIRFTQFYNTTRCCPTRASLLTGLHPHQAGIGHMVDDRRLPGFTGDLLPSCVTIAQVLQAAGYGTYGVGKWHVTKHLTNSNQRHNWPLNRGFDRYYGIITGATNFFEPATLFRDNTPISPFDDDEYAPDVYYFTTAISDYAVRYINEHVQNHPEKPFFIYIAHLAAHWPMQALPEDIAKYEGMYDVGYEVIRQARIERMLEMGLIDERWTITPATDRWEDVQNKEWEARCMEVYAAMIDSMDQGIGAVVNALKEHGLFENTVIMYLQDNGACAETPGRSPRRDFPDRVAEPVFEPYPPEYIVHRREEYIRTRDGFPIIQGNRVMPGPRDTFIAYGRGWASVSGTPFRMFKQDAHEGGIATPFIIHVPKLIAESMQGTFYREYGQLTDIMATVLELAGVGYPETWNGVDITPLQGVSLVPAFTGKTLGRETPLFWEHQGARAIREGKWKLVATGPTAPWELYDMESDRTEMYNLAGVYPEIAERMATQWENWAHEAMVFPWPWAQYQRRFQTRRNIVIPPTGLVFEMSFADTPLTDTAEEPNTFTIHGNAQPLQQGTGLFDGNTWIEIERSNSFDCGRIAWRIDVEIIPDAPNGVIFSQGGVTHGYSLYLIDGRPGFAVRLGGTTYSIAGNDRIEGNTTLSGTILANRQLVLYVNGEIVAQREIPSLIQNMPGDPPIIGHDLGGTVLDRALPAFRGTIKRIAAYRGEWTPVAP